tara:strand:- start:649 stop:1839 length:1191 start_codon:yes stop_codon:yes gene_type:complete
MHKLKWPIWPKFTKLEQNLVKRVVKNQRLYAGPYVEKFEREFKKFTNSKHSIAVGNATQGLHLALASLNIGEGNEVITTPFSFISTASCILMQNAIPVFSDCSEKTLSPSVDQIKSKITKYTKAIILVHPFGYSCEIDKISKLAKENNIKLIEDASHAHGMFLNGIHAGNFGDIGVFSLHQRKSLCVGDGGIIVTKNKSIEKKIRKLRSFGHNELSYNYRMTEFAGVLGINRLKNLTKDNKIRIQNAKIINNFFKGHNIIKPIIPLKNSVACYHKFLIRLDRDFLNCSSLKFSKEIQKFGIPLKKVNINKNWDLLHRHPHFNPKKKPSRGLPWLNKNYKGKMRSIKLYKNFKFPIIENIIDNELLELPIDPLINKNTILKACKIMDLISKKYNKNL